MVDCHNAVTVMREGISGCDGSRLSDDGRRPIAHCSVFSRVGSWRRAAPYVLRGAVVAVALLVLFFVLVALFVLSLPAGWNT